jgi:hypothetical protein
LRIKTETYSQSLDWLRYFCAFMLYMYGISKLLYLQFNMQRQLAGQPVGSLSGYQLTWFYFGHSRMYASILGLTQIMGATLLLFRKTMLLGALAMLPVMGNILLINIFIMVNDYGVLDVGAYLHIAAHHHLASARGSHLSFVGGAEWRTGWLFACSLVDSVGDRFGSDDDYGLGCHCSEACRAIKGTEF